MIMRKSRNVVVIDNWWNFCYKSSRKFEQLVVSKNLDFSVWWGKGSSQHMNVYMLIINPLRGQVDDAGNWWWSIAGMISLNVNRKWISMLTMHTWPMKFFFCFRAILSGVQGLCLILYSKHYFLGAFRRPYKMLRIKLGFTNSFLTHSLTVISYA